MAGKVVGPGFATPDLKAVVAVVDVGVVHPGQPVEVRYGDGPVQSVGAIEVVR